MRKKFLTVANQTIRVSINIGQIVIGVSYCTGKDADGVGGGKCSTFELSNGMIYNVGAKKGLAYIRGGKGKLAKEFDIEVETMEVVEELITAWENATC